MHELRLELFDDGRVLRLVGDDGRVLGTRPIAAAEIDDLVDGIDAAYEAPAPDLALIGRRLFEWIDGPGQRWLQGALGELHDSVALRVDVQQRLRHLPWELMSGAAAC